MSEEFKSYKVLRNPKLDALEDEVINHLNEGYVIAGGVAVEQYTYSDYCRYSESTDISTDTVYLQTVYKLLD